MPISFSKKHADASSPSRCHIEETVAFKLLGVIVSNDLSSCTAMLWAPVPSDSLEAGRSRKPGHSSDMLCYDAFCARICVPCVAQLSHENPSGQSGATPEKGSANTPSRSITRPISVYRSNTHTSPVAGRALVGFF